ncbi:hypothetical protein PATSB16_27010 [Pandoraea thiooxydans]|nr:hypothetical protein PATSB16_27010 [Pandoraea thiooxydans]
MGFEPLAGHSNRCHFTFDTFFARHAGHDGMALAQGTQP